MLEYEVAVIGGGSAGYAAARNCANAGLRTVVIESGPQIGGLCILRGCMPTKALLHVAEVVQQAKHSSHLGICIPEVSFNFHEIMARKDRVIGEFASYRESQLRTGKFDFLQARARFSDGRTLELSDQQMLRARNFIIATGSSVAPSPVARLDEVNFLTSDTALALEKLPKSLIVLGGGAVAVELAQFFCRLGVAVTLIQRSEHILKEEDAEAGLVVEAVFRREGMTVFTGTHIVEAFQEGGLKGVVFEHGGQTVRVMAEEILHAMGRVPNLGSLNLEAAGVRISYGRLLVNSEMQTNVPHIFGAGDCTGLHEIVHIAIQQAEIAAHNIIHPEKHRHMDYRLLTSVVFTDPQVARVGLTEREAKYEKIPYLSASYPFNDHGKSMIMNAMDGFVKLLADPASGEILGGSCVGPMGGELIHEIVVAMAGRMTARHLAAVPHYHPTLAEIWTYPAEELADKIGQ